MQLNDRRIKSIIHDWHNGERTPERNLRLFQKEVDLYIYNFPRLAYRKDSDFCSEFYIYVLDHLESIINNYPVDADIQFKTWFNYVLRNKCLDYYHKTKKNNNPVLSLDDYQEEISGSVFTDEVLEFDDLKKGLHQLQESDRLLIKLYYLPQSLEARELVSACKIFQIDLSTLRQIRRELLLQHEKAGVRIRELSDRLKAVNHQIMEIKYRLMKHKVTDLTEQGTDLLAISRLESSRYKLLQRIYAPDRHIMKIFVRLFSNINKARYRLSMAQKRLRFELLKKKRSLETKGGLV